MDRTRTYRIIAVVCAIIAAVLLLYGRVQSTKKMQAQVEQYRRELGERQAVLVPTDDIQAGTLLTQELLTEKVEPREYLVQQLPADVVADMTLLEGKIVLATLYGNEPILSGRLGNPDQAPSASAQLAKDRVAFALPTSPERAVGGEIHAGDHIDIIVADEEKGVSVLLANVLVMGRPGGFGTLSASASAEDSMTGMGFAGMPSSIAFPTSSGSSNILLLDLAGEEARSLVEALSRQDVYVALRSSR